VLILIRLNFGVSGFGVILVKRIPEILLFLDSMIL